MKAEFGRLVNRMQVQDGKSVPRVSVIVPVYNAEAYLEATVGSVLRQSFADFELILVDDGSTDRSAEIARSFSDARIRYMRQKNQGVSTARNAGLRLAKGEIVGFLDSDDIWHREKIADHVAHFDRAPDVGVSYSACRFIDANGTALKTGYRPKMSDVDAADVYCRNPIAGGSSALFRRAVFDEIVEPMSGDGHRDYFDVAASAPGASHAEDHQCWLRMALHSKFKFEGIDRELTFYRIHDAGLSARIDKMHMGWQAIDALCPGSGAEPLQISLKTGQCLSDALFCPACSRQWGSWKCGFLSDAVVALFLKARYCRTGEIPVHYSRRPGPVSDACRDKPVGQPGGECGKRHMSIALVTGSGGLIGAEAALFLASQGLTVYGVDNDMRAYFFGDGASTNWRVQDLQSRCRGYRHQSLDIRDGEALERLFREIGADLTCVIHAAAQPSHDWAAKEPVTDFSINAVGTLNLLEALRKHAPEAAFAFLSTNKVYGDRPNDLPLVEMASRWEIDETHAFYTRGIDETMSIDNCMHSIFGVSKASADLMVQEYGRYFGLKTACFRGRLPDGFRTLGGRIARFSGVSHAMHGDRKALYCFRLQGETGT